MSIHWEHKHFDDLTPLQVYRILQLRSEVFHLEQHCIYQDADNKDLTCIHLMGWVGADLAAYCRLVPAGISFPEVSIGRVLTAQKFRRTGAGRELIRRAIELVYNTYGKTPIRIGAQLYLLDFYSSFGFNPQGEIYFEDTIEHIEMLLP